MGCPVKIDDAQFLEGFYLDTKFPNCYTPHAIPGKNSQVIVSRLGHLMSMMIKYFCHG